MINVPNDFNGYGEDFGTYKVTLTSDTGKHSITTTAVSYNEAAQLVCMVQRAPLRSVVKVERIVKRGVK